MTIIDVKGTRDQASEPNRNRYEVDTAGPPSGTPFMIGFMIAAITLYVKSIYGAWYAESAQPKHHAPHDANEQQRHKVAHLSAAEAAVIASDETVADETPFAKYANLIKANFGSGKPLPQASGHSAKHDLGLSLNDASAIDYSQLRLGAGHMTGRLEPGVSAMSLTLQPSNDNSSAPQALPHPAKSAGQVTSNKHAASSARRSSSEKAAPAGRSKQDEAALNSTQNQFATTAVLIALTDMIQQASTALAAQDATQGDELASGPQAIDMNGYDPAATGAASVTMTFDASSAGLALPDPGAFDLLAWIGIASDGGDVALPAAGEDGTMASAETAAASDAVSTAETATLLGTDGSDIIQGSAGDDIIDAKGGDDIVFAGAGDDVVYGGSGNDVVHGEQGNDIIYGGTGNDVLLGEQGNDRLVGGDGNDTIDGGTGLDVMLGGLGDDRVRGSIDNASDIQDGGEGTDTLDYGASTADLAIDLATGTVTARAGAQSETDYHTNFESFVAGAGNDRFQAAVTQDGELPAVATATTGNDSFDGGAGVDTLDYAAAARDITVDVAAATASGAEIGTDTFSSVEVFKTGSGNDLFLAVASRDGTDGQPADSAGSVQVFSGGSGVDTLDYGAAKADVVVDLASSTATSSEIGTDGFAGIDVFVTGSGNDTFEAGPTQDVPAASGLSHLLQVVQDAVTEMSMPVAAADQFFVGGAGSDTLSYHGAVESILVDVAGGTASGAEIGTDSFAGIESFGGGAGDDQFDAGPGPAQSDASPMDDAGAASPQVSVENQSFDGGAGADTLSYETAADSITLNLATGTASGSEIGIDSFSAIEDFVGGAGNDLFLAGPAQIADDILPMQDVLEAARQVSAENQAFDGGAGVDTLSYETAADSIVLNLAAGTVSGSEIGSDSFTSVENFVGGAGNDVFNAGPAASVPEVLPFSTLIAAMVETDASAGGSSEATAVTDVAAAVDLPSDQEITSVERLLNAVVAVTAEMAADAVPQDQSFDGGAGIDTLSYQSAGSDLLIDTVAGLATGTDIGTDSFTGIEIIQGGSGNDTIIVGAGIVSVDGMAGNDLFVFLADAGVNGGDISGSGSNSGSGCEIVSFEVGDVIRMSKWDLFDAAIDEIQSTFQDIYGDTSLGADGAVDAYIPIRVRYEHVDDHWTTYVDGDLDNDSVFEMTVVIDGQHDLIVINNSAHG